MGWGGWMEEGGQAERSTRGGLRGSRGPRGEKLEKGRFKYQPPRGGPRARCFYLASFFPSRTDVSLARALSLVTPRATTLTILRRSSLMHTHARARARTHIHTESPPAQKDMYTDRRSRTHLSILGQRKGILEPFDVGGRR
jgi:hypothetical protein